MNSRLLQGTAASLAHLSSAPGPWMPRLPDAQKPQFFSALLGWQLLRHGLSGQPTAKTASRLFLSVQAAILTIERDGRGLMMVKFMSAWCKGVDSERPIC